MSAATSQRLVWALAFAMALVAAVLVVFVFAGDQALFQEVGPSRATWAGMYEQSWVPFLATAVAFLGAELLVVELRLREDGATTSLAELPMALALLFVSPVAAVGGRALGSAVALLPGLRKSPLKYLFNIALLSLTSALAVALHRVLLGAADPAGGRGWLALAASLAISHAVTSVMVAFAVLLTSPQLRVMQTVRVSLFGIGVTATLSVVGIFLGVATWHAPTLLLVDIAAFLGIYQLLRVYAELGDQYETLQRLYEFSGDLAAEASVTGGARISLLEGASLLGASRGDLYVPWAGDQVHWRVHDGHVQAVDASRKDRAAIATLAADGPVLLDARLGQGPAPEALRALGYSEVALAPVRGHDAIGWLTFDLPTSTRSAAQQRNLIASVAQQAASAMGRSELVDRLRAEVDEREHRALHDSLTGLPNRAYFMQRLGGLVDARAVGQEVAVLMIDLDRFKEVNDSLGHQYGDMLLREVGGRMRHHLRATEFLARLGGDEFGILVHAPDIGPVAASLAERISKLLEEPVNIADMTIAVGGSVGVSLCPRHADDPDSLLRQADIAMYAAKRDELPFVFYEAETEESWLRRLQVAGRLRASVMDEVIEIAYQPQINLLTGEVAGAEVLARWTDPELGSVSPAEFVPVAEQSGMVRPLTLAVLSKALPAVAQWRAAGHDVRAAVNLSGPALLDLEVVATVRDTLRSCGLPPEALLIEVTESVFVSDSQRLNEVLLAYEDLGVSLSIDDFGTGYSSLSYLRRLPADELKIDRSFVDGMVDDPSKLAIVRSTIALAHELGMSAVAEGIEDEPTRKKLAEVGCDVGQGFHLGLPMELDEFIAWLDTYKPGPAYAAKGVGVLASSFPAGTSVGLASVHAATGAGT